MTTTTATPTRSRSLSARAERAATGKAWASDECVKKFRCVRCGVDTWEANAACRDCISVDPVVVRILRAKK